MRSILIASLAGAFLLQPARADILAVINNTTVIVLDLVEPNPHSNCVQERLAAPKFHQTLNIMLSADVQVVVVAHDARGIPVVQLWDLISGRNAVDILVEQDLARTNKDPFWCE